MHWKEILRKNFTRWEKLADFLELGSLERNLLIHRPDFPLNLPYRLAEKIEKGTLQDPILRQFLPLKEELNVINGFQQDPLQEKAVKESPKLLHKYEGRALLVTTSACAMHCRYCFRQHFPYETAKGFEEELKLLRADESIRELILSGGDPLSLSDSTLEALFRDLEKIPHLRHLRFHTRFPVGIPERIDESFISLLATLRFRLWFVLHINHPREVDSELVARLAELQKIGVVLLNQTVLLRGVNDSVAVLKELSQTLVEAGILPYYLHQLDRVQGAHHFEVEQEIGLQIMQELTASLPGYAVPRYVQECGGAASKSHLFYSRDAEECQPLLHRAGTGLC